MYRIPTDELRYAVHCVTEHGDVTTEFFRHREDAEEFARNCAEEEGEDAFVSELVSAYRAPCIPPALAGIPDPHGWEAHDAFHDGWRRHTTHRKVAA